MKTEILCVIDRSGSMGGLAVEASNSFNRFIEEQKATPGEAKVTLAQFDDKYEVVFAGKDLADVPKYTLEARGMTALFDAVGKTLNDQGARIKAENWADKVIVVIVTDGGENASKEINGARLKEMVAHAEKHGWSFVYLAANVDPNVTAMAMGINIGSAMNLAKGFAANNAGVTQSYASVSSATASIRSGGTAQV